jgi:protein-S-isoprenylcysteine O-methyltransferase Ste14
VRGVLLTTLVFEALLAGSLVWSIARPSRRIWPPPSRTSWEFLFTWALTLVSLAGCVTVGVLGWNSLGLPAWLRFGVGLTLLVAGASFGLWGVRVLSTHASLGLGGELIRGAPYRVSRNPQYVGNLAALLGWALLAASGPVILVCAGAGLWFVLAPFSEEPWLRGQFGAAYDEYCRETPRFLGVPGRPTGAGHG